MWLALALLAAAPSTVESQVKPNAKWRTIATEHFYVHFAPETEEIARRAAVDAEDAYVKLSRLLRPPRGKIDLVVSDDVDFSNGFATPFPTNRIVIYANPPVFESALRFTDDPTELVVTHELAHVFHLDNVGGIWKPLQRIFGRSGFFFPNSYQPSWLVEGLAVYYETKLTGAGRIAGSEHRMIARTAALSYAIPRLDQLSLANPHFPYGYSAYAYGSLFVDHLARTHGDSALRTFVESSSRQIIPMLLDAPAHRAFRRSFTAEYRRWSDSLSRAGTTWTPPMSGWTDLTVDGAYASFPRWVNDSTLVYTGTPGRESYGAYRLTLSPSADVSGPVSQAKRERIARRHSRSPNAVLTDGSLLYSQVEFTSPYTIRSDLYLDRRGGGTRRLTRGARLAFPDARDDRLIVAVNTMPGGTRLALFSPVTRRVTPLTTGGLDEHWTEPRWSPDGKHIAAVRWTRGGTSEVVVIDTTGRIVETLIRERAINAAPSWSPDGRYVYFSSDRTGVTNLYRAAFRASFPDTLMIPGLVRLSDAQTGLFEPQPSPVGASLAAVVFKANGYHVGVAPLEPSAAQNAEALTTVEPRTPSPIAPHPAASRRYSPWRTLRPSYWMPFFEPALDSGSIRVGVFTSAQDVVGRHSYQALLFVPSDFSGLTGSFYYRNAGFGQPLVELVGAQDWENRGCIADASQQNRCIGVLRRRIREATLSLTLQRPRARTNSYLSLGGGVEVRDYVTDSTSLIERIDSLYRKAYYYPRITMSFGWSNAQFPPLAISAEDGFSLASTTRFRWRANDTVPGTLSLVGSGTAYKSLDLPGFAHHVLALRAAGGLQDNRGTGYFEVGGVSGGILDIFPGYTLGEGRRTFSVRGFPAGSQLGILAFAGSAEYRAPFRLPGRGLGTLPLFLDRTSVTLFGDVGSAWCSGVFAARAAPSTSLCTPFDVDNGFVLLDPSVIASVGGELNVSAAVLSWDAPFRYRLGVAAPVVGKELVFGTRAVSGYFTVGVSF